MARNTERVIYASLCKGIIFRMKARGIFILDLCSGYCHQESILCFNWEGRYDRNKWMNVSGDSSLFIVNAFDKFRLLTHLQMAKGITLSFRALEFKRDQSL